MKKKKQSASVLSLEKKLGYVHIKIYLYIILKKKKNKPMYKSTGVKLSEIHKKLPRLTSNRCCKDHGKYTQQRQQTETTREMLGEFRET